MFLKKISSLKFAACLLIGGALLLGTNMASADSCSKKQLYELPKVDAQCNSNEWIGISVNSDGSVRVVCGNKKGDDRVLQVSVPGKAVCHQKTSWTAGEVYYEPSK